MQSEAPSATLGTGLRFIVTTGCSASILYPREISNRARGSTNLIEQLEAVLTDLSVVVVDFHLLEKGIDRGPQFRHRGHSGGKVFVRNSGARLTFHIVDGHGERLLFFELVERGIRRAVEAALVLLLLDGQNIGRALGAREQILAVVGIEKLSERLDAADDHKEVVLSFQSKHRVHQIVPCALLAQLDL